MADVLLKTAEWVERWTTRIFVPVFQGLVLSLAWILRRGRYAQWQREARRALQDRRAQSERRSGSGWE